MAAWVIRWGIKFRLLVLASAIGILGFGVVNIPAMPMDTLPEFAPPQVEIQTEALGLSAVEVEQLITSPMEANLLNGVAWLDEIRSVSVPGLSSIQLVFEPGTDLLRARQLVAERLTQASSLPNVSTPPVLMQPLSSSSRVMMVQLRSDTTSLDAMSVLARWNIKPVLMGVPGVANVSIWGHREQQLQVQVDPDRLREENVSLSQIIRTTGNAVWVSPLSFLKASTPGTGGFLETANQRIGIQHVLPIRTPEDLGKVSIEGTGTPGRILSDVAEVVQGHQPLIGDAVTAGSPGLLLVIEKFPDAGVVELTQDIEEALDALGPGLVGITVDTTIFRPATFIETASGSLAVALLIALLLVTALIWLAFRSWRYALLGLVAMALSGTTAVLILYWQGAVLNTMVFAGLLLALAVVIGDIIADLNGLQIRHDTTPVGSGAQATKESVLGQALSRSRIPSLFAALAALLALAPTLFLQGLDGAFWSALAGSYLLAIAASIVVALTVTPALASLVLRGGAATPSEPAFLRKLQSRYQPIRHGRTSSSSWVVPAVAAVMAIAVVAAVPLMAGGRKIMASVPDRTLLVQWEAASGSSTTVMNRVMTRAGTELRGVSGVESVGGHVGRAITSDSVSDVSSGELWVTMTKGADFADVKSAVKDIAQGYPGVQSHVMTYPERQLTASREANEPGFRVRVYGADLAVLRQKAEEIQQIMASTQGVINPRLDTTVDQPVAEIEVNLEAAQKVGIKPGDVRRAAATILQGIEVGYLFEQQKVFQVIVQGTEGTRNSLTSVREMVIESPDGTYVPLGDVAEVRLSPNQSAIHHDNTLRRMDVQAEIEGRNLNAVTADLQNAIGKMDFPLEYHAEIPSDYNDQQASGQLTWWLAGAALVGILILLQTVLGSWRLAGLTLLLLPVALAGGVLGAWLGGGIDALYELIGFAAILGIAVRDSILLLGRYQTLQSRDPARTSAQLMQQATRERMAPTLWTSLATALLLVPFVVFGGAVGVQILLPLAAIVWGGLIASAVLTSYILPWLFLRFGPKNTPGWESSLVNQTGPELQERQDM